MIDKDDLYHILANGEMLPEDVSLDYIIEAVKTHTGLDYAWDLIPLTDGLKTILKRDIPKVPSISLEELIFKANGHLRVYLFVKYPHILSLEYVAQTNHVERWASFIKIHMVDFQSWKGHAPWLSWENRDVSKEDIIALITASKEQFFVPNSLLEEQIIL